MQKTNYTNLRSVARLPRQPNYSWQLQINDDWLITKNITDVSPTGLSFKAPVATKLEKGQRLKLQLSLAPGQTFECQGQVAWIRDGSSHSSQSGTMRKVGVQIFNVPVHVDHFIMSELNMLTLQDRRSELSQGNAPRLSKRNPPGVMTWKSFLVSLFMGIVAAAMTLSFLTALWMYEEAHPEDAIAFKFNQALSKKLRGPAQENNF